MIELRWIFVQIGSGRGIVSGSNGQMCEMVLQYRQQTNVSELGLQEPIWSAWTDAAIPSPFTTGEQS